MKKFFNILYGAVALLFVLAAMILIGFAVAELWRGANPRFDGTLAVRVNAVLESIGILTIAVAALELSQTVIEEEIRREAQVSAPTRVRRFLSRFLVVVVVALCIEALVATFQFAHEKPEHLGYAASVALGAAALLAAWGVFIALNRKAEELEPEAIEEAKQEDKRLENKTT